MHAPTLDRRPRFEVEDTPYGYWYSATRRPVVDPDKNKYVRTTHYVTPFWGLFPPPAGTGNMQAFVPVDDEHTFFIYIQYSLGGPLDKRKLQESAGHRHRRELSVDSRQTRELGSEPHADERESQLDGPDGHKRPGLRCPGEHGHDV